VTVDPQLARLAALHGVATSYEDQLHRPVAVAAESVVAVLAALGVDASGPRRIRDALAEAEHASSPGVVVLRQSQRRGGVGRGVLHLEDGNQHEIDGELAAGLPLGWHRLEGVDGAVPVVVVPDRVPSRGGRAWGWSVQLYATRSTESWEVGDLGDLATLARWTGSHGGGLVLVNPLHAVAPGPPMQPSPYYPASRRWTNPLYLRIEDLPEYAEAPAALREAVDRLRVPPEGDRIDRDRAWAAKRAALDLLWPQASVAAIEPDLLDYATWAALCEVHGDDWRAWPPELRHPGGPAVAKARGELAERVRFHAWLQQRARAQRAAAHRAGLDAGLTVGIVHDLAVGCDPGGADAWMWQDVLALGARVGAPPDTFNQQGQDWGVPPWHPRRLAERGYAPLRDLVRSTLAGAGGLRLDHVLGLFRLWWVPAGASARDGSYVASDAEALLGVVALEAARAGAIVVGEDLGTVAPEVRRELAGRDVLGTSVLWFEREEPRDGRRGALRPLAEWREAAVASVTTHDLPTALGWLRGEHVRLRHDLGLLDDPEAELRSWREQRRELVALLVAAGLVEAEADDEELVLAMHLALARTPSRYVLAAPGDAVGDLRQPNVPATVDEYPNWRLAVADVDGRPLLLGQLLADPRVGRLARELASAVR
jgi:4-alpha-glucanotransferase